MYHREWVETAGVTAKDLTAITVVGDSMAPQIRSGDTVLIRRDKTVIEDGRVYAFDHGTEQRIKRVFRKSASLLVLSSDNATVDNPPEIIKSSDLNEIKVIGLVWHRTGPIE